MNPTRACPKCGAPLPADAPQGHCPQCLLALAVQAQPGDATRAALEQATLDSDSARLGVPPSGGSGGGPAKAGTPNASLQFTPGDKVRYFGDYELLEEIARGGMGVVWKARQVSLNRLVAVKMILAGKFVTEAEVRRFRTEAEAAANLQHPNIVAIHEVGEHEGQHYFSMDYVEGCDLAHLVKAGPLPVAQAARCVQTIAGAIAYAHERGTLHRDLKPHNVLIDQHGQPRITDFGLAKLTKQDSSITQEGAVMGSPSYMPPEQAAGRQAQVGPHSDVYSIGALLYHLLTGKAPFVGPTAVETLRQVLDEEPVAPGKLNAKVPADLETICLKCLRKQPAQRYATAQEVADELGRFLNYEPIHAQPANSLRRLWSWAVRHPWAITGLASVLLLSSVGVAYHFWERVRLLEWQHKYPNSAPPYGFEYFFRPGGGLFLGFLAMEFFLLQGLPLVSFLRLRAKGRLHLAATNLFLVLGLTQVLYGLHVASCAVAAQVWAPDAWASGSLLLAAFTNVWFGSALTWKATQVARQERSLTTGDAENAPAPVFVERPVVLLSILAVELALFATLLRWHASAFVREDKEILPAFFHLALIGGTLLALGGRGYWTATGTERQAYVPFLLLALGMVALGGMATTEMVGWLSGLAVLAVVLGFVGGRLMVKHGGVSGESRPFFPASIARHFTRRLMTKAALATVASLLLVYLVEDLRGWLAWSRAKARVEARGEKVDWAAFAPSKKIPDEQNVFRHPFILRYGIRQGWNGEVEQLDWLNCGFVGPGVNDPSAVTLASLKSLPRARTKPATFAGLNPGLAATGAAIESLVFEQAALADVVVTLGKQTGIQMAIETNAPPFAYATNRQVWNEPAKRWDWLATNVAVQVSFRATNTTALSALETLLAQHHYQPESGPRSDTFQIRPILTSLPELLARLSTNEVQLAQLDEALNRPQAQLPWEGTPDPRVRFQPNYVLLRKAAQGLNARSTVHLLQGNPDAALNDMQGVRRIADLGAADSSLVGAMVKTAILGMLGVTLRDSLAESLWPRPHLAALQELVEDEDLLRPWAHAMQYERATDLAAMQRLVAISDQWSYARDYRAARTMREIIGSAPRKEVPWEGPQMFATAVVLMPRGWVYQNMARATSVGGHEIVRAVDRERLTISTELATRHQGDADALVGLSPYHWITRIAIPNYTKSLEVVSRNQTMLNQAHVALALERHRAAKGAYPDTLAALVPEFAAKLPHDLFDGQPLRYRRTSDGKYLLYSIGWNSKDDGGTTGVDNTGHPLRFGNGPDWVWQGVPKL